MPATVAGMVADRDSSLLAGTSLTGLYGVGPVVAAVVIGDVRDASRFPGALRPVPGAGRATGEQLCRQRGRIAPQAPALRTSHSRARSPPYDRVWQPPARPCPCPGQSWPFPGRCHPPPAQPQVQVERPQRSEDERPGGAARRRPHSAVRKARGQGSLRKPQRPKGTSQAAKNTGGAP